MSSPSSSLHQSSAVNWKQHSKFEQRFLEILQNKSSIFTADDFKKEAGKLSLSSKFLRKAALKVSINANILTSVEYCLDVGGRDYSMDDKLSRSIGYCLIDALQLHGLKLNPSIVSACLSKQINPMPSHSRDHFTVLQMAVRLRHHQVIDIILNHFQQELCKSSAMAETNSELTTIMIKPMLACADYYLCPILSKATGAHKNHSRGSIAKMMTSDAFFKPLNLDWISWDITRASSYSIKKYLNALKDASNNHDDIKVKDSRQVVLQLLKALQIHIDSHGGFNSQKETIGDQKRFFFWDMLETYASFSYHPIVKVNRDRLYVIKQLFNDAGWNIPGLQLLDRVVIVPRGTITNDSDTDTFQMTLFHYLLLHDNIFLNDSTKDILKWMLECDPSLIWHKKSEEGLTSFQLLCKSQHIDNLNYILEQLLILNYKSILLTNIELLEDCLNVAIVERRFDVMYRIVQCLCSIVLVQAPHDPNMTNNGADFKVELLELIRDCLNKFVKNVQEVTTINLADTVIDINLLLLTQHLAQFLYQNHSSVDENDISEWLSIFHGVSKLTVEQYQRGSPVLMTDTTSDCTIEILIAMNTAIMETRIILTQSFHDKIFEEKLFNYYCDVLLPTLRQQKVLMPKNCQDLFQKLCYTCENFACLYV